MPVLRLASKAGGVEEIPLGKIIGIGRNYLAHAQEMKAAPPTSPLFFLKPASSYLPDGGVVRLPSATNRVEHEVEMAVVVGRTIKDLPISRWKDAVLGYGVLIDLTARDLQEEAKKRGDPWALSKSFDTFTPISTIIGRDRVGDPQDLDLELLVNGEQKQKGNTKDMIFPVSQILEYLSRVMTLERGDVIATGTPERTGPVRRGDQLEARLHGLVSLKVRVDARVEKG